MRADRRCSARRSNGSAPSTCSRGARRRIAALLERIRDLGAAAIGVDAIFPEPDRTWFAVAAYNVGLGHLEDARILAGLLAPEQGRISLDGRPWLDTAAFRARFEKRRLPGLVLRDHDFQPTFHKYQGQVCRGFQKWNAPELSQRSAFTVGSVEENGAP